MEILLCISVCICCINITICVYTYVYVEGTLEAGTLLAALLSAARLRGPKDHISTINVGYRL